jgi:hypothetical protein
MTCLCLERRGRPTAGRAERADTNSWRVPMPRLRRFAVMCVVRPTAWETWNSAGGPRRYPKAPICPSPARPMPQRESCSPSTATPRAQRYPDHGHPFAKRVRLGNGHPRRGVRVAGHVQQQDASRWSRCWPPRGSRSAPRRCASRCAGREVQRRQRVHDADDAKFSLQRAMSKTSNYAVYTQGMDRVAKVDGYTIDIFLKNPNPVLLNQLTELRMMSRPGPRRTSRSSPRTSRPRTKPFPPQRHGHRPVCAQGVGARPARGASSATRTGGAGKDRQRDRDRLHPHQVRSHAHCGAAVGRGGHGARPQPADLARIKANAQALKVLEMAGEPHHLPGMDQFRDELPGSNIKGKNPLKDLRVRKALYQAIDIQPIKRVTMRGLSQPTGTMIAPRSTAGPEGRQALPFDAKAAQEAAGRGGLPADGLRGGLCLQRNRYHQRRAAVPGHHLDVGQGGREGQAAHAAVCRHLLPDDPAHEASIYAAGLGRAHVRRAVHAAVAGAHQDHAGGRWQLQPGPLQQPADGRAGGADQEGSRPEEPQRPDRAGLAAGAPGCFAHPPAQPGNPVGG